MQHVKLNMKEVKSNMNTMSTCDRSRGACNNWGQTYNMDVKHETSMNILIFLTLFKTFTIINFKQITIYIKILMLSMRYNI